MEARQERQKREGQQHQQDKEEGSGGREERSSGGTGAQNKSSSSSQSRSLSPSIASDSISLRASASIAARSAADSRCEELVVRTRGREDWEGPAPETVCVEVGGRDPLTMAAAGAALRSSDGREAECESPARSFGFGLGARRGPAEALPGGPAEPAPVSAARLPAVLTDTVSTGRHEGTGGVE